MRSVHISQQHKDCHAVMIAALGKVAADLPAEELLAIASYVVGKILAFQNQHKMSSAQYLQLISDNIEAGNAAAIADVRLPGGTKQ